MEVDKKEVCDATDKLKSLLDAEEESAKSCLVKLMPVKRPQVEWCKWETYLSVDLNLEWYSGTLLGLNFFVPMIIKKRRSEVKVYGCLFVCMAKLELAILNWWRIYQRIISLWL